LLGKEGRTVANATAIEKGRRFGRHRQTTDFGVILNL
jgi:hypothetical protein